MKLFKELHDTFVPHPENEYKPHFFRVKSVLVMMIAVVVLGLVAVGLQRIVLQESDYLAAVISSAIVNLTNVDRGANNLAHLSVNPVLERAAQLKAEDMAAKGYFAHTSPEGKTPWHWFKETGYRFTYAGENLAIRFSDSIDVERAWMNSPTHRANILNSHFTEIGVGIAEGMYEGQPTIFVVQLFGRPAVATAKFPSFLGTAEASTTPPKAVTVASSSPVAVKGETVEAETTAVVSEDEPNIIIEDETFIAVRSEVATNSPLALAVSPDTSEMLVQKLITSPKSVVEAIYLVLAAIVVIALIVMIVVEARHQHPQNVALGVALVLLMAGLLYVGQYLSPGTLAIL